MTSLFGILLSLLLLMYLAYRDVSVIVLAPLCALVAVLCDGDVPLLAAYTQIFMGAVGQFVVRYFPLFLLGALFGRLMEDTGSAARLAELISRWAGRDRTILAMVLSCAVLTYGGVSLFVVVFAVFPLCCSLFREADIPRRLIPAVIALGSFTFTMTALPGSVQIQNLIPMPYFGTDAYAAPVLGCLGSAVMLLTGMMWLNRQARAARRAGEGFSTGESANNVDQALHSDTPQGITAESGSAPLPPAWVSMAPLVCVIVLNFVFSQYVVPRWQAPYLAEARFGGTDLSRVQGLWATILALSGALVVVMALNVRSIERLKQSLATGARSCLLPVFNTASEFGYGSTIAALSGFSVVRQAVSNVAPGNPLISEAVAVNVLAGITGSASGGLSIALESLGATFAERGLAAGVDPQLLHRVASMSCGGLDSLPHNGAVITLLIICGVTHRQAYRDVAVVSIVCPLAALVVVLLLGTFLGVS